MIHTELLYGEPSGNRLKQKPSGLRFKPKTCVVVFCVVLCCFLSVGGYAQQQPDDEIAGSTVFGVAKDTPFKFVTFTFENDFFVGDDDGFTNGTGFTYGKGPFLSFEGQIPGIVDRLTKDLYIQSIPDRVHGVAYMLFQTLQTPQDITSEEFQPDDLPYAGLVALETQLYSWDTNVSDQLALFLGLVGPAALGEQSQTAIHRAIGSELPQGWDFQLDNEPVFRLQARRVQKLYRFYGNRLGFDVLALGTAGIGNLLSDAEASLAVRWGSSLDFSHATFSLQSDRQVNSLSLSDRNDFFLYLGVSAGLVANDILIDGNTFSNDSPSPGLEHFRNNLAMGAVAKLGRLAYVFQFTSNSKFIEEQQGREKFGAFSITYPFK